MAGPVLDPRCVPVTDGAALAESGPVGPGSSSRSGAAARFQAACSSASRNTVRGWARAQAAENPIDAPRSPLPKAECAGLRALARMAQQHRQAQAEQLPGEAFVGERVLELAQAAALAEHEQRQPPLLGLREAGRVGVREQVGAVAMVVVVRDQHAQLVQRGRPGELAPRLAIGLGPQRGRAARAPGADPRSACARSTSKRRCSSRTDVFAQVVRARRRRRWQAFARARRSRPGAARRAPAAATSMPKCVASV